MAHLDVFNGDADGICALHQLRLADPHPQARLMTGVKRDIQLLENIPAAPNLHLTVLDISFDKNRHDVLRLLESGATIIYFDHHFSGTLPAHDRLSCWIDPDPLICTSLLVDRFLGGRYRKWAIVGAYGDNLDKVADTLAAAEGIGKKGACDLRETGILLNYNGYGSIVADLHYPPDSLYQEVHSYTDPLAFHAESSLLRTLREGYQQDMEMAGQAPLLLDNPSGRVVELADAPWARRAGGVYANHLANEQPDRAHAILTRNQDRSWRISVRAPLNRRHGADALCRQFPSGGGRAAAAGINHLPENLLDSFFETFTRQFAPNGPPTP